MTKNVASLSMLGMIPNCRDTGTSAHGFKKLDSAKNLNALGSEFFLEALHEKAAPLAP